MAIDLLNVEPNVPQVNLLDYSIVISGNPKSGKTSLFAKMVERYCGNINKGLILAFEKGYTALKVNAVDLDSWEDFEEAVDQLVEHKDQLTFEMIALDTVDIMWEYVQQVVIDEWNMQNPTLRARDINQVGMKKPNGQGFGVGYNRAKSKIRQQIDKLQKAGYGVVAITHSKDRKVEEKSGLEYDQLQLSLSSSAREVFVNMADFINFITIEKEQEGDKLVTKRYIYFRGDGFIEAGSRFPKVPDRIEYDVDTYIETIENAIRAELEEGTDVESLRKKQLAEKEKAAQEFVEEQKAEKSKQEILKDLTLNDLKEEFKTAYNELDKEKRPKFVEQLTEKVGVTKPSELNTKEKLYDAIQIIKSL